VSTPAHQPVNLATAPPSFRRQLPVQVLWITSLVSIFGNTLTAIAVPWFVLETTDSAGRTGVTAAVTVIPVVIATFLGGALVDRMSYRFLSVFSDLVSAATVAAVPFFFLTTGLSFPGLLALMFLGAIFDAPGSTARQAMVPPLSRLTGISLERINANFGMIAAASSLFSAPFAGLVIAWFGPMNVLWFNAGTFIFSGLAVWLFIPRLEQPEASGETFTEDVKKGFRYVRDNALIRTIILGALSINFLFAPLFGVAIPFFANQELQSVRALGIMLGAEGLGGLAGAFAYGKLAPRFSRRAFLVASLFLLTAPILPLAFSSSMWVSAALLVSIGFGSGLVNPMIGTFLQVTTPAEYMGRVMGLVRAGAMVAQPVGLLLGGVLIGVIGFTGSTVLLGTWMLVTTVAMIASPALRELDAIPDQEIEHAPEVLGTREAA
jgi:MFS family permease